MMLWEFIMENHTEFRYNAYATRNVYGASAIWNIESATTLRAGNRVIARI